MGRPRRSGGSAAWLSQRGDHGIVIATIWQAIVQASRGDAGPLGVWRLGVCTRPSGARSETVRRKSLTLSRPRFLPVRPNSGDAD